MNSICSIPKPVWPGLAAIALVTCASPADEPSPQLESSTTLGQRLDDYLSSLEPFGFSGAVLVAEGDQIHLDKGYGFADESKAIPNTGATIFQVGSVTKQFTAAAIMTLVDQGKLHTTDTLPKFFEDVPSDKQGITLRHLLTHTSGVVAGDTEYFDENSRDEIVIMILREPLDFEPGEGFLYSNMGYALLAAVVEDTAQKSYEDYLRERLFLPEEMSDTGYRLASWDPDSVAHWYADGRDNGDQLDRPYPDWNFIGSGRLRSTTRDMLRWHRALMSDRLLSDEAKSEMYTPAENNYAYGWVVRDTDRGRLIQHNGASSDGAAADFRRYVDEEIVVVAFCNRDGEQTLFGNRLANHIDDIVHGAGISLPPSAASAASGDLEQYVGIYRAEAGLEAEARLVHGLLTVKGRGQQAVDALYGSNGYPQAKVLSEQASEALSELIENGNAKPFGDLLANPDRRERFVRNVLQNRSDGESELGSYRGLSVLGTVQDWISTIGGVMTIVRLEFEDGNRVFRLHWKDAGVLGIGGSALAEPADFWLQPTEESDAFGGYHLPTATTTTVRFHRNPSGQIDSVSIGSQTDSGEPVFLRR